jgi:hypothetical protein
MADESQSASPSPLFPAWQREYEAVLSETDNTRLFKRVEVAEAAVLLRLEALSKDSDHHTERQAIDDALTHLGLLKRNRLGFDRE